MRDEDENFWTTWIATTPEEGRHYRGCGLWLLLIVGLVVLAQ